MTKEERAIYNKGLEDGCSAMHKQIYGHWRYPADMQSLRDGYDTIKIRIEEQISQLRENIEYLDREDRDRIETTIYNMRQTLKFVAQQYNQIPQMNEEEVEQHEARLEANG